MTLVRDTTAEKTSNSDVLMTCEFLDEFPEELLGLPPHREIEFYINMVSDIAPVSMPPYRMAIIELRELKKSNC